MKLFISYRRAAWSFTYWLAEELDKMLDAQIFVDFSGINEANFETALLRNLRESDVVLVIVTEHTFAPDRIHNDRDWVRREIREAIQLNKPIVLACQNGLVPPPDLPDDLQPVRYAQGIEFYPRFFKAGVHELAAFIDRVTPIKLRAPIVQTPKTTVPASRSDRSLFDEATSQIESGQYERALELLELLRARDYKPRFVSLEDMMQDVTQEREAEQRRWEAGAAYDEVAALARINVDRARWAWIQFRAAYPTFTEDPVGLEARLSGPVLVETQPLPPQFTHSKVYDLLPPPFAWMKVPAGRVTLQAGGRSIKAGQEFDIPAFAIAKYPITNAQFAPFVEAGGYRQQRWWLEEGWAQRTQQDWIHPRFWREATWNGPDYPVVGVSWFEALAFCRWLSEVSGEQIVLPTEQQWQRAAQGDDGRAYPWGNAWDGRVCNNSVGKSQPQNQTSPVEQYEGKGDSPFGVVDMAGNVWEWCVTTYETGSLSLNGEPSCALRGGSCSSVHADNLRVTRRLGLDADMRVNINGFRCVRLG